MLCADERCTSIYVDNGIHLFARYSEDNGRSPTKCNEHSFLKWSEEGSNPWQGKLLTTLNPLTLSSLTIKRVLNTRINLYSIGKGYLILRIGISYLTAH